MKHYDLGNVRCTLEKTSSGYYKVVAEYDGNVFENMFSNKEQALEEILSYAEVDEF